MTDLQEEFRNELKSKQKLTVAEYAALYNKNRQLAIEQEKNNGAHELQANAMGNYYTIAVLSNFIGNENILARIIAFGESAK